MSLPQAEESGKGFTLIPDWLARMQIPWTEKFLWARLHRYSHKTGEAYPSQETLAEGAGITRETAGRCLRRLEGRGLIDVERRRKPGSKRFDVCLYHAKTPSDVLSHGAEGRNVQSRETFCPKPEGRNVSVREKNTRDKLREKKKSAAAADELVSFARTLREIKKHYPTARLGHAWETDECQPSGLTDEAIADVLANHDFYPKNPQILARDAVAIADKESVEDTHPTWRQRVNIGHDCLTPDCRAELHVAPITPDGTESNLCVECDHDKLHTGTLKAVARIKAGLERGLSLEQIRAERDALKPELVA